MWLAHSRRFFLRAYARTYVLLCVCRPWWPRLVLSPPVASVRFRNFNYMPGCNPPPAPSTLHTLPIAPSLCLLVYTAKTYNSQQQQQQPNFLLSPKSHARRPTAPRALHIMAFFLALSLSPAISLFLPLV